MNRDTHRDMNIAFDFMRTKKNLSRAIYNGPFVCNRHRTVIGKYYSHVNDNIIRKQWTIVRASVASE